MTRAKINLFEIFRNAMMRNKDASRRESFDYFIAELRKDTRCLEALAEEYFYRQCASWTVEKTGRASYALTATPSKIRESEHIDTRRKSDEIQAPMLREFKAKLQSVILFDVTLPTGKTLRDSTFADCAKAGGWLTEVARHGKGTEAVDKKLTETDLRNIWKRYADGIVRRGAAMIAEMRAN